MKIFLLVLLSSTILFTLALALADEGPKVESQMTSHVRGGEPVDNISSADTSFSKTHLWSSINNCNGCKISHTWYLNGDLIYRYQTTIEYDRARWWTARPGTGLGNWTADVVVNGKVIDTLSLDYRTANAPQQQILQRRIKSRRSSECEDRLAYFKEQAETNDDPYIRFMIKKWTQRCEIN